MAISVADRKRLRDGAGGECSSPGCRIRGHLVEAHIVADRPDGPRGDASFTKVQLDAYDNRILLCPNHHSVVDGNPAEWTVEKLRTMKAEHEEDIARRLAVVATESEVGEDFWLEPGAPTFRVGPGVDAPTADTVKLLMTFAQTSGDEVTPVIEWSGANADPSRPLMMPQNQPPGARYQKYQLKPALARPSLPRDEVTFDIRFRWRGATRQYRWSWPLFMREKGIWGMHNVGENTLEPRDRTTLSGTVAPQAASGGVKEGTGTTTITEPVYAPKDHANEAPGQAPTQQLGATPASPRLASRELHFADTDIEYVFGEPGRPGYPKSKTGATRLLRAEAYFICLSRMQVESVELEVQGKSIPSDWQSTSVYGGTATGRYIYLEIPPEVTAGPHEVKLVAFADGIFWKSESSNITFPPP